MEPPDAISSTQGSGNRRREDHHQQITRGRGNGRHRGRGGISANVPRGEQSNLRRTRGHLHTGRGRGPRSSNDRSQEPSILNAVAAEFIPGQNHPAVPTPTVHRARRASILKSAAPDIATRTHEDIENAIYECPICTNEVQRNSRVWSCHTCWTVFHLKCVEKWSQNEGSAMASQALQDGRDSATKQWRCPGCNLPKEEFPCSYFCWCRKEIDPVNVAGIPPHSCGQTCGRQQRHPKRCPHPCELLCHAGPCPPCHHMGPTQICFCGKQTSIKKCIDTNYDSGWSCGEICGDLLPCGEHTCKRPCHEGLCGACEIPVQARCYCGKTLKEIICIEKDDEKESNTGEESWTGIFSCLAECRRAFDCGIHRCERPCHAQDPLPSHCPNSPDIVKSCPCGKTLLDQVIAAPRTSCNDPIPNCSKQCLKKLRCGHPCERVCHSGECPPCFKTIQISCRCGRTSSKSVCDQGYGESPQCMRVCKATLNCGRHECGEHCCPGEKKAMERQATKRKLRPLGTSRILDDGIEAEHICTRICGRILKCGNHECPELCHKGPCRSCREAIFDEVSCHCGRTVLQPPLPCGTQPPICRFDCERARSCGHPQVQHNCHGDGEACPKCPFLVEKPCMCGKKSLKNQPCFLADVRCGEICGRKLKCGSHFCRKQCHRPGECEDSGKPCVQPCGKEKKCCGHPCEDSCHAPSVCKEDKPCQHKLLITCDCQHLKTETKCLALKMSEGNTKKSLKCDDECGRLERNRRLAMALNIDPATHHNDHIPYSSQTLQLYQEFPKWAQAQEKELRMFAADEEARRYRFKPMPAHQRTFVHSLLEDFGLDGESVDPEPHRHIAVFKTPKFVAAPMKTLADCIRIRTIPTTSVNSAHPQGPNDPFNAFLLTSPRFALTVDELRGALQKAFATASTLAFDISFLPDESVLLRAKPSSATTTISPLSLAAFLKSLKPALTSAVTSQSLASSVLLCAVDHSLNIVRKESDSATTNDGWSQVAAKAAVGPRQAPRVLPVGMKSSFVVLGQKAKKKKEEVQDSSVVDDWEEEMRKEEQAQELETAPEGHDEHHAVGNDEAADVSSGKPNNQQDIH